MDADAAYAAFGNVQAQKNTTAEGDVRLHDRSVFSEYNKPITLEDIKALRDIGRKSINDFSTDEVEVAQKWAYKFYQQLGTKSPFFRRWFGDWRAFDKGAAKIVSFAYGENGKINYSKRTIHSEELNAKILVDETIVNDSLSYAKKNGDEKQIRKLLGKIDEVISNGILLDTRISERSSGNKKGSTQFMHYLYTPISINGAPFITKVSIEEYDLTGKNRAYNLQRIELSKVSRAQYSQLIEENREKYAYTFDALSVAQLFDFVKQNDKNFNPKPVNEALINKAEGTPRIVYHYTDSDFWEFDTNKSGSNQGQTHGDGIYVSTSSTAFSYAGKNRMELYVNIRNPFEMQLTDEQAKVKGLAKLLGLDMDFVEDITTPNGQQAPSKINMNTGKILLNRHASNAYETVLKAYLAKLGHESGHKGEIAKEQHDKFYKAAKSTKLYKQWLQEKTGLNDASVEKMESHYRTKTQQTRKNAGDVEGSKVEGSHYEMIADFMGDVLFAKDEKILQQIVDKMNAPDRNAFLQWVIDVVNYVLSKLGPTKNIRLSAELRILTDRYTDMLKRADEAYARKNMEQSEQQKTTNTDSNGGYKFSVQKDANGKDIVVVDTDQGIFVGVDKSDYSKVARQYFNEHFKGVVLPLGNSNIDIVSMSKKMPGEYAYPHTTLDNKSDEYSAKMKAMTELDNLLKTAGNHTYSNDTKGNPEATLGWDYYEVIFLCDGQQVSGLLNIANSKNGRAFYDMTKIKVAPAISEEYVALLAHSQSTSQKATNNKLAQKKQSVNTYSMQDTEKYSVDDNSENKNVNTEYVVEYKNLVKALENGEISLEEFRNATNELYYTAGKEYGTIKQGESVSGNENFTNAVPKKIGVNKRIGNTVRTILEGGDLTEDMVAVVKQQLLSGDISYVATSNENNIAAAKKIVESGIGNAKSNWNRIINSDKFPAASGIALGELLLQNAIKENDAVSVVKLTADLAELGTRAGQVTQAFSLLKRLNGVAQLLYVQRSVNKLNEDLIKKYGEDAKLIEIDEIMAQELANSKTEEDFNLTYESLLQEIASQVPATFLDKWNAWRYMAMLFNPITHIRNIYGNAVFIPSVMLKDTIGVLLEKSLDPKNRTKTLVIKSEYKKFAENYFKSVEKQLTGTGKMNPTRSIADNKKIFNTKWLEALRKFNFDMLEKEDAIFLKKHFVRAFGSYLQVQKVDLSKPIDEKLITKAEQYAMQEALKNTYRDANKIANLIDNWSKQNALSNVAIEGV